jgi:hypothetical protein
MPTLYADASKGLVTARDPATLKVGELAECVGGEYHVGSPHLYKQLGRTTTGTALGAAVQGIVRAQYDTGDSKLIAVAGGIVYESDESTTPTFASSGLTGLSTTLAPHFTSHQERWIMCNGTDSNYLRETEAITGGSDGNWRPLGMQQPTVNPTYTTITGASTTVRPITPASGTYTTPERAYDADTETSATGSVNQIITYTFTTNFGAANCILYVDHAASTSKAGENRSGSGRYDGGFRRDARTRGQTASTLAVDYSVDNGVNWLSLTTENNFARTTSSKTLTIGTAIANVLKVRATTAGVSPISHLIYDIRVAAGAASPYTLTNTIYYGYTEIYVDGDGVEYESSMSSSFNLAEVLPADFVAARYGIILTMGAAVNTRATMRGIYRSLDETTGGFPYMYRIATPKISEGVTFTDDFAILPSDTATIALLPLLSFFSVTYNTGETLIFDANVPPPTATMALPFAGVMTYIPSEAGEGHRLYYSLASTISPRGLEQVPTFQYLDFQSPRNDLLISIAVTNGGKSLLAFFSNYTMLVNYLPQASDGVFDNRVKEYVSNNRGTAGRLTCCEFTLPAGQTLVGSVDSLGLWVTNGVNQMDEWSRDLDWATDMADIDLSTAELVDNTPKRRLELLYTATDGSRQERHFFYGRLKEDGDGKPGPIHTGPHPMGVRCKHYTQIGTGWVGFSGDSTSTGGVFLEESGYSDDANGYDSTGIIPWAWTMGDVYLGGISNANILETLGSKFTSEITKAFTITVTTFRDVGQQSTHTKTLGITVPSNLYLHFYSDRFRVRYTDLTATQAPAFVGQEAEVRSAGPSRDK